MTVSKWMIVMKKLIAVFAVLTLLLCGVASHAETAEAGAAIKCLIENGSYVIQVESGNGLGWIADDMAQDDSVVKLGRAESLDGVFVARYDPVGDGDATVSIRHYTGIACDEAHTFDLRVENGAVTESTGGSFTASPDETEQDPYLCGEWLESETQFTRMTIAKNEGRGDHLSPDPRGVCVQDHDLLRLRPGQLCLRQGQILGRADCRRGESRAGRSKDCRFNGRLCLHR